MSAENETPAAPRPLSKRETDEMFDGVFGAPPAKASTLKIAMLFAAITVLIVALVLGLPWLVQP